ncbi:Cysteine proteinase inhibitor [Arachis hypogaea]|uniref:Cystatin domain-containing protein n=1 Tax=Arachis hypogaea TaxID=3818 RepID=A0A445DJE9_ARAHY|nr:Cysteine proteinase inhibitor [Arachis hypogaea]RYR63298.1 hypothetical protein Ahy_A04g021098 [Arachis hypogaea]
MDVNDPRVMEIANFAITEYNHKNKANLKLVKIENCVMEARVGGNSYQLVVFASMGTTGENNKKYFFEPLLPPSSSFSVVNSSLLKNRTPPSHRTHRTHCTHHPVVNSRLQEALNALTAVALTPSPASHSQPLRMSPTSSPASEKAIEKR